MGALKVEIKKREELEELVKELTEEVKALKESKCQLISIFKIDK